MVYFLFAATLLAACAAWVDWRTGHIPNKLTLGGLVIAIVAHGARGACLGGVRGGLEQLGYSLGGALLCAVVPLLMFHKGAMGGGDVKLFAAIGALLHPLAGLETETYALVAAALLAPLKLVSEGKFLRTLFSAAALLLNLFRPASKRRPIPEAMVTWFRLGPAIFLGTASTLVIHLYSWSQIP